MSRAFVKEDAGGDEALPDRPVSTHPNYVTPEGLARIEAELARLHAAAVDAGDDRAARAAVERDLRYWRARRANAEVIPPPADASAVRFGSTVTIVRDDGRQQVWRIVGEDEADPKAGHALPRFAAGAGPHRQDGWRHGADRRRRGGDRGHCLKSGSPRAVPGV